MLASLKCHVQSDTHTSRKGGDATHCLEANCERETPLLRILPLQDPLAHSARTLIYVISVGLLISFSLFHPSFAEYSSQKIMVTVLQACLMFAYYSTAYTLITMQIRARPVTTLIDRTSIIHATTM